MNNVLNVLKIIGMSIVFSILYIGIIYFIGGLALWVFTLVINPSYILLPNIFGGICRACCAISLFAGINSGKDAIDKEML